MSSVEELSREELLALVGRQAALIDRLTAQVAALVEENASLRAANEDLSARLARAEYLLSRNSGNCSMPPSGDDAVGRTKPAPKPRAGAGRARGKQKGAARAVLPWSESPDRTCPIRPEGRCVCGSDLGRAVDLGVVDRYQETEIPLVVATVTQYEVHAAVCGCGRVHTPGRPAGVRAGATVYGPNLRAWCVYLLVVQFLPVQRVCRMLEELTGAAPSPGFVHGMIRETAAALREVDRRIRALITLAYAVCLDETPLRAGAATAPAGKVRAERYLMVACTRLYTHYLLGDRSLETFKASVLKERTGRIIVHDRYQNYDSTSEYGPFVHQLCTAHILRDLAGAGQTYPDAHWPAQIARHLRALIHAANQARAAGLDQIEEKVREEHLHWLRAGVRLGLDATAPHRIGTRPGEAKARALMQAMHEREADVLRFAFDLKVPATSNQAERDLRPAKIQQKISGRLTSEQTTSHRYTIRGVLSTAAKHGVNQMRVLRDAITGDPWYPPEPTT